MIIGLTGSLAMGKSETAKMFKKLGIPVFDADAAVHELYDEGGAAVEKIRQLAPQAIKDGVVDRKILSKLIAQTPQLLDNIEQAIHPLIVDLEKQYIATARKRGEPAIVIDHPLLFETGTHKRVDHVIVVSTTPEIQRARALSRPGMTGEKLKFLLDRQMPDHEKRSRADFVIDTGISLQDAFDQLQSIMKQLDPTFKKQEIDYA